MATSPASTAFDRGVRPVLQMLLLDKAEAVSRRLLSEYPDQVDDFDRLAMVYEARGDRKKAAQYYRKAADFARSNPDFGKNSIDRFLSEAKRMESDQ